MLPNSNGAWQRLRSNKERCNSASLRTQSVRKFDMKTNKKQPSQLPHCFQDNLDVGLERFWEQVQREAVLLDRLCGELLVCL